MFSKFISALTTVSFAISQAQLPPQLVELAVCFEPDCSECEDIKVQVDECVDARVAGLLYRCTPDLQAVELDVILDTKCSGTPIYRDIFAIQQCHNVALKDVLEISFDVATCSNVNASNASGALGPIVVKNAKKK